jgi:hypothetical protein
VGKRVKFTVRAQSKAAPDAVYRLLRNGQTWPMWSPIGSFELAEPGVEEREGVGAVRVFKTGLVRSREEIIALTPDRALSYRAVAGMPFRDHRADVRLEPVGGGTAITWREEFYAYIPGTGWMLHRFLRRFVQMCANGLGARAEASRLSDVSKR